MKIRSRRTEISIETREVLAYKHGSNRCPHCGQAIPPVDITAGREERNLVPASELLIEAADKDE